MNESDESWGACGTAAHRDQSLTPIIGLPALGLRAWGSGVLGLGFRVLGFRA